MPVLKTTPLNAVHREMGARMVDFGGWDMPLHYGSQLEEHHAVRRASGMFDVAHMAVVDLHGARADDFLRTVLANDVAKLKTAGKALYSCMLNEAGGVIDDLIVYFVAEQHYRLVINAGTTDKDLAWLRKHAPAFGVEVHHRNDLGILAVQGPQARDKVLAVLPPALAQRAGALKPFHAAWDDAWFVGRTGYTGEDGFELVLPAGGLEGIWRRLFAAGVRPCGLGARDTLRLEAGMNLYGQDMDESTTPLETGLTWTVAMDTERDFIGKTALMNRPPLRHALGLVLADKGVMRGHQVVVTVHGAGEVTSGGFGPTLERSIALARVPLAVQPGDRVEVEVRGKSPHAQVVKPPFVRHGKILVALQ
ncbi:MAG TPA: glycine cleavage system aminomethyltransferase GcvT [Burkholderiales bacterium]|nr:glycine cleavage system aminomethyltransferase GcvT [Burkholderiales bacterium]